MTAVYLIVLAACSLGVLGLIAWRLLHLGAHPRPSRGRLINEWIWTIIPVGILAALIWSALMRK
ncbi:MAG: hypothetical protein ACRD1Y_10405 [Terriglobales bacterium]